MSADWKRHLQSPLPDDQVVEIRREWGREVWRGGYAGLTWPVEHGGRGLGPIEEYIYFEEAARARAPETLDMLGKYLAGPSIILDGTEPQKRAYLRPILAGDEIWCEGYSEPNAGSDLANVSTRAEWDGSLYRIHGTKIWTSHASIADRCYLLVKTSSELPRHHNLSVLLVDMHQAGIEVRKIRDMTGGSMFTEVIFDGAIATRDQLLGEENKGWALVGLSGPFRKVRILQNGLRIYVELHELVEQYEVCGSRCVRRGRSATNATRVVEELRTQLGLYRWHLRRLAELQATNGDWLGPASIVRVTGTEFNQSVVAAGLDLHCYEHEAYWRHWYLRNRMHTIAGGTAQIQRNVIANSILKLPR
jgi:alkylation response protein AidB-like acyl-CoA dehydrogenase